MHDTDTVVSLRKATPAQLAKELIAQLDQTYDLIYIGQGDGLSEKQVNHIVEGDWESLWASFEDWEGDTKYESAKEIITDDAKSILRNWENEDGVDYDDLLDDFLYTEDFDEVRFAIEERETGDWVRQLIGGTGTVLLRIDSPVDEDASFSYRTDVTVAEVLERFGLPDSEKNREAADELLAEAAPEWGVSMGQYLVSVDLDDVYNLPTVDGDYQVEVHNPAVWLGNMFAGSGYVAQFEGVVRVPRSALHTDKGAFGYSWTDVAGVYSSAYPGEVKVSYLGPQPLTATKNAREVVPGDRVKIGDDWYPVSAIEPDPRYSTSVVFVYGDDERQSVHERGNFEVMVVES